MLSMTGQHWNKWYFSNKLVHLFQSSVTVHIETSNLFCTANQMIVFYMNYNTGMKWVKNIFAKKLHRRCLTRSWIFLSGLDLVYKYYFRLADRKNTKDNRTPVTLLMDVAQMLLLLTLYRCLHVLFSHFLADSSISLPLKTKENQKQ